jgi:AcrR family transcriptional regulator
MKKPATRRYTLGKRAAAQEETRRRIVAAAVALHGALGPARTSFSDVAARAGVQRHTLYAHFPDELSLLRACSAHDLARDPPPDPAAWRAHAPGRARLGAALAELYAWYARRAGLIGAVLRDAEHHAPTRAIVALHLAPLMAAYRARLGTGLDRRGRALLALALDFAAWRALAAEGGLAPAAAAAAMADAVHAAPPRRRRSPGTRTSCQESR